MRRRGGTGGAGMDTTMETGSPSGALEDVFDSVAPRLGELTDGLEPSSGQVGVLVAIGGRAVSLDLFDHPHALAAYWPQLVQGYALDALSAEEVGAVADEAERFLREVETADVQRSPSTGLGTDVLLDAATVTGIGIDWDGALRHLAAFRVEGQAGTDDTSTAFTSLRSRRQMAARRRSSRSSFPRPGNGPVNTVS